MNDFDELKLDWFIVLEQLSKTPKARDTAKTLGINRRTVYRYVLHLEDAFGVPMVVFGKGLTLAGSKAVSAYQQFKGMLEGVNRE